MRNVTTGGSRYLVVNQITVLVPIPLKGEPLHEESKEFIENQEGDIEEDQEMADRLFNSFIFQWPELENEEAGRYSY